MKMVLVLMFLISSVSIFANDSKVGFINYQQIMRGITDGKKILEKLEKRFNERKESLKGEEEKIKKSQADLQKQNLVLSDKAKSEKEKEIQKAIFELQNKTLEYQKEINEMEAELKKPIMKKLDDVVQEVSSKAGVLMTFEISTSPVVYAKTQIDLTEDVIKLYNSKNK